MRKHLLVIPFLLLVLFGCSGEGDPLVTATGGGSRRAPDMTYEASGAITKFYDFDNPYTIDVIDHLVSNTRVRGELARFGPLGYELSRENSYVTEETLRNGRHVEMAVLSLANASPHATDAIYLFCVGGADPSAVGTLRFTAEDPRSNDYVKAGPGVWFGVVETAAQPQLVEDPGNVINWHRWGRCLGAGFVADVIACHYTCRWLTPVYMRCLTICTGIRFAATVLNCTIMEL